MAKLKRPVCEPRPLGVGQELHHDGRGGERQCRSGNERRPHVKAHGQCPAGDGEEAQHHLQAAQPEDQPPHRVEPFEGQLQANEEEQEDNAQLSNVAQAFRIADIEDFQGGNALRREAHDVRAQQNAHHEEGHHSVDPYAQKERHGKARNPQYDQEFLVVECGFRRHLSLMPPVWGTRRVM